MASTPLTTARSPRAGLARAAAVTGLTLAGGATLAGTLGWLHPATAPGAPLQVPAPTAESAGARVVLVPVTPERLAPVPGADPLPSTVLGPAVADAAAGMPGAVVQGLTAPALPVTHVDQAGNVWAWYGTGDWVLLQASQAAIAAPAPQARRAVEHEARESGRAAVAASSLLRDAPGPGQVQTRQSVGWRQEGHGDD